MTAESLTQPERQKQVLDDNARKFVVDTIDPEFLRANKATSYNLISDWLETGEENEKKIVYKEFEDDSVEILLISKVAKDDGGRVAEKERLTPEEYERLLQDSKLHIVKQRTEFQYVQDQTSYSMKYDEFADSLLRVLEVDASNDEERADFDFESFPVELTEVTGNMNYYGHRVSSQV